MYLIVFTSRVAKNRLTMFVFERKDTKNDMAFISADITVLPFVKTLFRIYIFA